MSRDRSLYKIATIYGIVITALILFIFGGTIIGEFIEKGRKEFGILARDSLHWYDNPTGFFITYIIGYALAWWKPLTGATIIITGSLLVIAINLDNTGFLIFALPTMLVGIFYLIYWSFKRKGQ